MLHLHLLMVFVSISSFIGRNILLVTKPELLQQKVFKIAPHAIDTLLLLSGFILLINYQGGFAWILSKFVFLSAYIGLGVVAMHSEGQKHWIAFGGALLCFVGIIAVALSKSSFF